MKLNDFYNLDLIFREWGIASTAVAGATTEILWQIPEQLWMSGASVLLKNAEFGDYIIGDVIDVDNILGFGANTVIDQFADAYYVSPTSSEIRLESALGAASTGLYIRFRYVSSPAAGSDVEIRINLFSYKPAPTG